MKFNPIDKVILFGGSRILAEFSSYIKSNTKFKLIVFSSKRHLDDYIFDNLTLRQHLDKENISYLDCPDINSSSNLAKEITVNSLGIAMGAAWVFDKLTVNLFEKFHLLDFMGIDLPHYKGGAHYTWQILHENKRGCANLQLIHGGVESFHKGEIIKRFEFDLPSLKKPIDFFNFLISKEAIFLKNFLDEVTSGQSFDLTPLDESQSSFFPFLNTKLNGLIDWSWLGKDIFLFINAFDDPYPGASTFLKNQKVFLKDCELLQSPENFHPFTSGIVIRKDYQGVYLASQGNLLLIKKIVDEQGNNLISSVTLGDRFFTPISELDKARGLKVIYNSRGLGGVNNE